MAVTLVRETKMEGSIKEWFLIVCGAGSLTAHDKAGNSIKRNRAMRVKQNENQ